MPISLYQVGHQLHHQLRNYKAELSDMSRDFLIKTAAILGYFLQLHEQCIADAAGGPWDVITSVPSSTDREGEHPLVRAIKMLPDIRDSYEPLLERGTAEITHTVASDDGYRPLRALKGERILLIDDTLHLARAHKAPRPPSTMRAGQSSPFCPSAASSRQATALPPPSIGRNKVPASTTSTSAA